MQKKVRRNHLRELWDLSRSRQPVIFIFPTAIQFRAQTGPETLGFPVASPSNGVLWIGLTTISIIPNENAYWKEMLRTSIAAVNKSPALEREKQNRIIFMNGEWVSR